MGFRTTDRRVLALLVLLAAGWGGAAQVRAQFAGDRSYPSRAGTQGSAAVSAWEEAERSRDAYETVPEGQRTKAGYTRVLDEFRAIYHQHPQDGHQHLQDGHQHPQDVHQDAHAAEAVNAVAELLAEEGRGQHDAGLLRAAVKQYEYLRTQYPGSSLGVGALLTEAQIERIDLGDAAAARERYTTFLELYPRSSIAEEARAGLASLDHGAAGNQSARGAGQTVLAQGQGAPAAAPLTDRAEKRDAGAAEVTSAPQAVPVTAPIVRAMPRHYDRLATVTGIRHWSTPTYTRVAIDLGSEVEYEAARVPGPDRIYFDLHGARLAPELVGKSFTVTDDGFLKKIRVAQSGDDLARIVLDVNDVTEYSAFLLPNPYRLIIDIHGRSKTAAPAVAMMDAPARPAATVPNTRAVSAGSGADVARLSEQPGKVEATTVPTSQPISAVVPGRGVSTLPGTPVTGGAGRAGVVGVGSGDVGVDDEIGDDSGAGCFGDGGCGCGRVERAFDDREQRVAAAAGTDDVSGCAGGGGSGYAGAGGGEDGGWADEPGARAGAEDQPDRDRCRAWRT